MTAIGGVKGNWEDIVLEYDKDGDGEINLKEFVAIMINFNK